MSNKVKKDFVYVLTIVSVCSEGIDVHSYPFKKKKDAQDAMKSQYKNDKNEIDKSVRVANISKDGYEVYEDGRYIENSITAEIVKREIN